MLGTMPEEGNGGGTGSQQGHTSPTPRPQRTDSVGGNYGSNTGATAMGSLHRTGLQGQSHTSTFQPHHDQAHHTDSQAVGGNQGSNTDHDPMQRPADPERDRPWWVRPGYQGPNPSRYYTSSGGFPLGGPPPSLEEQIRNYNTGRPPHEGDPAPRSHQSNRDGDRANLNASPSSSHRSNLNDEQSEGES